MAACVLMPHQTPSPTDFNRIPDCSAASRAITKGAFTSPADHQTFYNMPVPMLVANGHNFGQSQGGFLRNMMPYTGSMQHSLKLQSPPTSRHPVISSQHDVSSADWPHTNPAQQITSPFDSMTLSDYSSLPLPDSTSIPLRPSYGSSQAAAGTGPSLSEHSRRMNSWPTSQTSPPPIGSKERKQPINDLEEADDSDEEDDPLHPNKFATILEHHSRKECGYRRQATRSGPKVKQVSEKVYNPFTGQHEMRQRVVKYYEKDLVRYCVCGKYEDKSALLTQGRSNDCKGYEIHYSQKCKWKGYTDYNTKETVLIRLCKCYKPT